MAAIEVFINTDIDGFFFILYPVKIKVKDGLFFTISILVYKSKRRAAYILRDTQRFANSLNKRRFPCTHCAVKGNNSFISAKR